jgi:indolepyruvate ferredoxin oxidoreductase
MRRVERRLVADYRCMVADALNHLTPETQTAVAELAALPDLVRGYEAIKLAAIEQFHAAAADRLSALRSIQPPSVRERKEETA